MSDDPYVPRIEWERCAEPITLRLSEPIEGLPPGIESITIRRNEQYQLVADLAGAADSEAYGKYHQKLREQVPGTIRTDGVDVVIKHKNGVDQLRLSVGARISWTAERGRFVWNDTRDAYTFRERYTNRPEIRPE